MRRRLPDVEDTLRILKEKRTRPLHRPPPPASRALRGFMKDLDGRFGQGASALIARWREIVGADIARRTEPVKLIKGRNGAPSSLEIRVAGPSAAIIQHQAQDILARAATEAELMESLSRAPEGRLKDALITLGRGVLRRGGS
jgi:hypothetical protein